MLLKGKEVILRPLRLSDAPRFVKWFNDPRVNRFLHIRRLTLARERKWLRDLKKGSKTDRVFAIDTHLGAHIGSCGLHKIDRLNRCADFGIMIGEKRYWGKGLGAEAARLILDYGFKKLKLHRIELDVYEYNQRAIKVYRRLGFKMEGKKREKNFWRGKFWDTYLMAVLDKEWKN